MYAFVMRPESLPKSYQDFIQKTGPVAQPVYKAVRDCCRGSPVDVASLSIFLSTRREPKSLKLEEFPSIIPCSIIHPDRKSCLAQDAIAASDTFRKTFPLYFSLTFVPFVVLRLQKVMPFPGVGFLVYFLCYRTCMSCIAYCTQVKIMANSPTRTIMWQFKKTGKIVNTPSILILYELRVPI